MSAGTRKKRKRRGYPPKHHRGGYTYTASAITAAALRERVHGPTAAALRVRVHGLTAAFNPLLHPRGKDGQFINIGGFVKLSGLKTKTEANNHRAKVTRIEPNGNVFVRLVSDTTDQPTSNEFAVKPENISRAPEKARLANRAALEALIPGEVNPEDAALLDELRRRVHEFNEREAARRWAEAEVSVIEPNPEAVAAADEADLDALRARVHAMERRRRARRSESANQEAWATFSAAQ